MSVFVQYSFLHGRLSLRRCAPVEEVQACPTSTPSSTGSAHLTRLAQSKCIQNIEGGVEIGEQGQNRFVSVNREQFLLEKGTEVHRSTIEQEVFLWWCTGDKVLTLWLEDATVHKLAVIQQYLDATQTPASSDIIPRPRNPAGKQRPLSAYRKSLVLVDNATGEVVSIIQDDIDLADSPTSSTPTKKTQHADDKPGGVLAHKVEDIVNGIHPAHDEVSVDLENPDWSGDSSTEGLLYLNLQAKVPLPPLVTEASPAKGNILAGLNHETDETRLRTRTASAATVSTLATFRTGLESLYVLPAVDDEEPPSAEEPLSRMQEASVASVETARPSKEDSSDAILLEFLGAGSTMRLSRIRKPASSPGRAEETQLKTVNIAETPSLWSWIPLASLWESLTSWSGWLTANVSDVRTAEAVDARKRREQLARLSVVYVDTFGHRRNVLMRR